MFVKQHSRQAGLLVVLLVVSPAVGQVDHRVNYGNELGTGRALDRNSALGSGGVNQAAAGFNAGYQANSIVSGNYSGLAGFHETSPVVSTNQFRESLPSAGLSSFYGRSVGGQNLQPYQVSTPTYYFGGQETVSDLGYIRSGLNAPASSTLWSSYASPPRLLTPTAPQPLGALPATISQGLDSGQASTEFGFFQRSVQPPDGLSPLATLSDAYAGAAKSSIFGVPRPFAALPARSVSDLWPLDVRTRQAFSEDGGTSPGQAGAPDLRGWKGGGESVSEPSVGKGALPDGFQASIGPQPTGPSRLNANPLKPRPSRNTVESETAQDGWSSHGPGFGGGSEGASLPSFDTRRIKPGGELVGAGPPPIGLPESDLAPSADSFRSQPSDLGRNRFADLYRAVRTAQSLGVRDLAFKPRRAIEPSAAKDQPSDLGEPGVTDGQIPQKGSALARRSDLAIADLASAARWARDLLEEPITTFVAAENDEFNSRMAAAETALKAGKYYLAAGQFEIAHLMSPDDPLPLLGRGHALAAAGDYWSAAVAIQQGLEQFPQITAFRLDLVSLVGQPDIFDLRRADLEDRLARNEQYELRFLLGYLEFYTGLPDDGLRDLEQAAKEAPPDSIISVFPGLLLGRPGGPTAVDGK